ncbi:hypothetical protein, partial [Klebsiella pneumoniae]|uniref:hypothetical protein n=1 Tax=Klebsiella pneumoniae TaxID=573 RepID=UPI001CA37C12
QSSLPFVTCFTDKYSAVLFWLISFFITSKCLPELPSHFVEKIGFLVKIEFIGYKIICNTT